MDFFTNIRATGRDQGPVLPLTRRGVRAGSAQAESPLPFSWDAFEEPADRDRLSLQERLDRVDDLFKHLEAESHAHRTHTSKPKLANKSWSFAKNITVTLALVNLSARFWSGMEACARDVATGHLTQMYKMNELLFVDKPWKEHWPDMQSAISESEIMTGKIADIMPSGNHMFLKAPSSLFPSNGTTHRIGSTARIHMSPKNLVELNQEQPSGCTTHSASMVFVHEFGHAHRLLTNPVGTYLLHALPDSDFLTMEEYLNSKDTNLIAAELGEPPRHAYQPVIMVPSQNVTDRNNGICVASSPQEPAEFLPKKATLSGQMNLIKIFANKNFPIVPFHTLAKTYSLILKHNKLVGQINAKLKNPEITDAEKQTLKDQWQQHRDEAVAFADTFKGVLASSFAGCPLLTIT